jgi:hypothetical protein
MAHLADDLHPEALELDGPAPPCSREGLRRPRPSWPEPLDRPVTRAALGLACGSRTPTPHCPHRAPP